MEWSYWYDAGKSAAKAGLGILVFAGPQEWAQAWTRGYIAYLAEKLN